MLLKPKKIVGGYEFIRKTRYFTSPKCRRCSIYSKTRTPLCIEPGFEKLNRYCGLFYSTLNYEYIPDKI
jgi:hypothetical protein